MKIDLVSSTVLLQGIYSSSAWVGRGKGEERGEVYEHSRL